MVVKFSVLGLPLAGNLKIFQKCSPELPANSGYVFGYFLNNMVRSTRIGQRAKQCPPATTMFSIFMGTNLPIHGRPFLGFVSTPCCLFMTRSFCIFKTTVSFLILTNHLSAVCETTMTLFPARLRRPISSPL